MENLRTYLKVTISLMVLLIIVPFVFYITNFFGSNLSSNTSDWGTFGDYFGGILNPIIGITNIVVLIIISYQIAGWDNKRHKNEFLYKAYCNLSDKLDKYKTNELKASQLKELSDFLVSFKINQQFLFERNASIIFNERVFGLETASLQLRNLLLEDEEAKKNSNGPTDVGFLITELIPHLIQKAKEDNISEKYKEFESERQYLIGFFQRILNNSSIDAYSQSSIIANDGKDRSVAT